MPLPKTLSNYWMITNRDEYPRVYRSRYSCVGRFQESSLVYSYRIFKLNKYTNVNVNKLEYNSKEFGEVDFRVAINSLGHKICHILRL